MTRFSLDAGKSRICIEENVGHEIYTIYLSKRKEGKRHE